MSFRSRPLKIAYFSPLPPARSGIADYSRDLLPHLAEQADLTLYAEEPASVDGRISRQFPLRALHNYPEERWLYDAALFQMGNSDHHKAIYRMFLRYPGVVVLHETFLHLFVAHNTVAKRNYPAYTRELGYALGAAGIDLSWRIRMVERPHPFFEIPLNDRLLDLSLGVIVHSQFAQRQIWRQRPAKQVSVVPHLITKTKQTSLRAKLDLPDDTVIFATAGLVTANKKLDIALRAFGRLRQTVPNAAFLIIGEILPEVDVPGLLGRYDLQGAVKQIGFKREFQTFLNWIATADVILSLRHPTIGETSGVVLRSMAAARPNIVFDHGWYSELPDDACVKIPPLDEDLLFEQMLSLARDPQRRQQIGRAASRYIREVCDPVVAATATISFIEQILAKIGASYS